MSSRTQLTEAEVAELQADYPTLPADYFRYLVEIGWGEAESGRMIYSGPTSPLSIYGSRLADNQVVLVGDDMQGYCFGFDKATGRWGEFDDFGKWEPWPEGRPFSDYVKNQEV